MKKIIQFIVLLLFTQFTQAQLPQHYFKIGEGNFLLDGKPFQIISGEMHFARIPREYWHDRLRMAKAMGLNTICTYVFWNYHETEKGKYNFSGNADVAAFVKVAQQEGLWVIIRPSPYACAEWEFGGYPWWLIKEKDLKVRSRDPKFLEMSRNYINAFAKELTPLQITKGGPVIMVQLENEYGSYDKDKEYLTINRNYLKDAGFDVDFYTCDGPSQMPDGYLSGLLPAVNGWDDPNGVKILIDKYNNNQGPYFIAEWYPAWFDSWGVDHHTVPFKNFIDTYDSVLAAGFSINIYMVHGGTTRAFWNGANMPPFRPQTTSYDYDAPINEAGNATPKFMAMRNVIKKYLSAEALSQLPEVPETKKTITTALIKLDQATPLFDNLPKPILSENPLSFEDINQGYGYVLYRTTISGPLKGMLYIKNVRDYALVFINGKRVAILDRRFEQDSVFINLAAGKATLDILVENMGRINYGPFLNDNRKGITEKVIFNDSELKNWEIYGFPFNDISNLKFSKATQYQNPVMRKGSFMLDETADTYLDFSKWGKGCAWINGHNLGRYWNIGPTQTMYVPAPWLKKGENEIIIFEELKYNVDEVKGIENPILDIMGTPKIYSIGSVDMTLKKSVLTLNCKDASASVFYSIDGKTPTYKSSKYTHPLSFNKPVVVSVIGRKFDTYSDEILKINIHPSLSTACKVNTLTKFSDKYIAGGEQAVADGFLGSNDLRDGFWQGYEGNDFHAIIDLGKEKDIASIRANFLQDAKSWIFLPSQVEFSVSTDGKDYTAISKISSEIHLFEENSSIWKALLDYSTTVMAGKKVRYVSVKAKNIGVCPPNHPGAGGKAWLFVDEITVH
jgi:beta-galactosidase